MEIDRLQKTELYAAGTVASSSRRVLIGRQDDASPVYFEGNIHVTHVYDRSLTVEEISELYSYYGYATTNYPGRVLIRKLVCPEPNHGAGGNEVRYTPVHDIVVVNSVPSPSEAIKRHSIEILVDVRNEGTENETFNVTAYYDSSISNTTDVSFGKHELRATC